MTDKTLWPGLTEEQHEDLRIVGNFRPSAHDYIIAWLPDEESGGVTKTNWSVADIRKLAAAFNAAADSMERMIAEKEKEQRG